MTRIWDPYVRLFHWGLVAIVISNRFINEDGGAWHNWLGYLACALVVFRIIWALTKARFRPRSAFTMLIRGLMLFAIVVLGLSGWIMSWDRFFGEEWLQETHAVSSNVLLALIVIHVVGIIRESIRTRENLVASMIHGKRA